MNYTTTSVKKIRSASGGCRVKSESDGIGVQEDVEIPLASAVPEESLVTVLRGLTSSRDVVKSVSFLDGGSESAEGCESEGKARNRGLWLSQRFPSVC